MSESSVPARLPSDTSHASARTPHRLDASARFERTVRRALAEAAPPSERTIHVLVAASGGADSTALLLALAALRDRSRAATRLSACHVDHGLRSRSEREAERAMLQALCERLDVELLTVAVDVAAVHRLQRLSWEDAARRGRYAALGDAARSIDANIVTTGHTADDQVETLLLRLLRGTGVRGLRGIEPVTRPWGELGPRLVRPLLSLSRSDTESYCRDQGQPWTEDSTNRDHRFRRNRVRHELLPLLSDIAPGARAAVLRLAGQAGAATAWIDGEVQAVRSELWRFADDQALLCRPGRPLHPFLGAQVVVSVFADLTSGGGAPSERVVAALLDVWRGSSGRRLSIGSGWQAEAGSAGVSFRRSVIEADHCRTGCWRLVRGETSLPGWLVQVRACVGSAGGAGDGPDRLVAYVPEDAARDGLSVRFWQRGDRMRPAGMQHDKKLQDIFVDEKVPRQQRHRTPLLFAGGRCIWVVGVKRSAGAAVCPGKHTAVRVSFLAIGDPPG